MAEQNPFSFHHMGVVVEDMDRAASFYTSAFGFRMVAGPFDDPLQKVKVCFLGEPGQSLAPLELITPLDNESPVNSYLKKEVGAYHLCYEVPDLEAALAHLRSLRCMIVRKPVPAVAFGGRKIAWCFTPTNQLLELLESEQKQG